MIILNRTARQTRQRQSKYIHQQGKLPVQSPRSRREFPDGDIREHSANLIAESIYSQVDDEGRHHLPLESLVDHYKDDTDVPMDDGYIISNGNSQKVGASAVSSGKTALLLGKL